MILGCATLGLGGIGVAKAVSTAPFQTNAATVLSNSWDFTAKTTSASSYSTTWKYGSDCEIYGGANNSGGWAYIRTGGKSTAAGTSTSLTSTYKSTVASTAVYSQIVLTAANIASGSGFTMNSITLTVASNKDFSTVIDTISGVGVATSMTWSPTAGVTWASGSYYKLTFASTSTTTSNRGMDVQSVKFYTEGTEIYPTDISVSLASATLTGIGGKTTATATVSPSNVSDPSVTWSSSNENVAVVDANGNVTSVGNGTANIVATSVSKSSISGFALLTVSGIADASAYDKIITISKLGFSTSYTSGVVGLENIAYKYADTMKGISYPTCIQMKAATGFFQNVGAFPNAIKQITWVGKDETDLSLTLKVGTTNAPGTLVTGTRTGSATVFDVSSLGTNFPYFKFESSASNASYAESIVIELINTDVEAARAWAASFLNATNVCDPTGAVDNITSSIWSSQSTAYSNLSVAAKKALTDEACLVTVTTIQQALARYKYVVNKYGSAAHANFIGITVTPAARTGISNTIDTSDATFYVIGSLAIIAAGAFFIARKKKQA